MCGLHIRSMSHRHNTRNINEFGHRCHYLPCRVRCFIHIIFNRAEVPFSIVQARAYGADACLLIASVLPNKDLELLIKVANKLGLHQLIEVRSSPPLPPRLPAFPAKPRRAVVQSCRQEFR